MYIEALSSNVTLSGDKETAKAIGRLGGGVLTHWTKWPGKEEGLCVFSHSVSVSHSPTLSPIPQNILRKSQTKGQCDGADPQIKKRVLPRNQIACCLDHRLLCFQN